MTRERPPVTPTSTSANLTARWWMRPHHVARPPRPPKITAPMLTALEQAGDRAQRAAEELGEAITGLEQAIGRIRRASPASFPTEAEVERMLAMALRTSGKRACAILSVVAAKAPNQRDFVAMVRALTDRLRPFDERVKKVLADRDRRLAQQQETSP